MLMAVHMSMPGRILCPSWPGGYVDSDNADSGGGNSTTTVLCSCGSFRAEPVSSQPPYALAKLKKINKAPHFLRQQFHKQVRMRTVVGRESF